MKKNVLIRTITAILVLVMLVGCFAACGEPTDSQGTTAGATDADGSGTKAPEGSQGGSDGSKPNGSSEVTTDGNGNGNTDAVHPDEATYLPTSKNYESYEFVMCAPKQNIYGTGHFCHLEGSQDIIDVALFDRELLMQDLFGFIMTLKTDRNSGQLLNEIGTQHNAQKHFADVTYIEAKHSMTAAQTGKIWNLNLLEELNLEACYYDQRIQQNFRIGDMLFQITGDYANLDELVTFGVLYNDYAYSSLEYYETQGTPYAMVYNYQWTYDKMMELAQPYTVDSGETLPQDNQWGIVSEDQAIYYFYMGSGIQPMSSINGELQINLLDQTTYANTISILTDLLPFGTDSNVLLSSDIKDTGEGKSVIASDIFEQNRALFRTTSLSDALYCNEMERDFGILPIPMYDAAQQSYYNMINADAAWPLCIPYYVKDVHQTAEMIERMSYYSRFGGDESLYEAFFERLSLAKICRKEEDRAMLELVFSTKVYCLDSALDKGSVGLRSIVIGLAKSGPSSLVSKVDPKITTASKALKAVVQLYTKSNENQNTRYDAPVA